MFLFHQDAKLPEDHWEYLQSFPAERSVLVASSTVAGSFPFDSEGFGPEDAEHYSG